MCGAVAQSEPLQQSRCAFAAFDRIDIGVNRRNLDIGLGGKLGQEIVALKHETKMRAAKRGELIGVEFRRIPPGDAIAPFVQAIEAAQEYSSASTCRSPKRRRARSFPPRICRDRSRAARISPPRPNHSGATLRAVGAERRQPWGTRTPSRRTSLVRQRGADVSSPVTTSSPSCKPSRTSVSA